LQKAIRNVKGCVSKMYEKTILEESNVDVFNEIGEYAKGKNLNVLYFKVKMPVTATRFITSIEDMNKLELGEVDYIHLYDNKEYNLILSIYYDTKGMNIMIDCPYYEVFDRRDVEIRMFRSNCGAWVWKRPDCQGKSERCRQILCAV
jgi:hypothetical protein